MEVGEDLSAASWPNIPERPLSWAPGRTMVRRPRTTSSARVTGIEGGRSYRASSAPSAPQGVSELWTVWPTTGTETPFTVDLVCTKTRTGWPTASELSASPSARNASGSACSRRLREAPMKVSGTRLSPTAIVAAPRFDAMAASKARASMRRREFGRSWRVRCSSTPAC